MESFDYAVLHTCQFEVDAEGDCGEPATHEVWWGDYGKLSLFVCQEHFNHIKKIEEADKGVIDISHQISSKGGDV